MMHFRLVFQAPLQSGYPQGRQVKGNAKGHAHNGRVAQGEAPPHVSVDRNHGARCRVPSWSCRGGTRRTCARHASSIYLTISVFCKYDSLKLVFTPVTLCVCPRTIKYLYLFYDIVQWPTIKVRVHRHGMSVIHCILIVI